MQNSNRGRDYAHSDQAVNQAVTNTPVPPTAPRNLREDMVPAGDMAGDGAQDTPNRREEEAIAHSAAGPVFRAEETVRDLGDRGPRKDRADLAELSRKLADLTKTRDLLRSPGARKPGLEPLPDYMRSLQ